MTAIIARFDTMNININIKVLNQQRNFDLKIHKQLVENSLIIDYKQVLLHEYIFIIAFLVKKIKSIFLMHTRLYHNILN